MTVAELIHELQHFSPDWEVVLNVDDEGWVYQPARRLQPGHYDRDEGGFGGIGEADRSTFNAICLWPGGEGG